MVQEVVIKNAVKRERGYLYYVDAFGNICRSQMKQTAGKSKDGGESKTGLYTIGVNVRNKKLWDNLKGICYSRGYLPTHILVHAIEEVVRQVNEGKEDISVEYYLPKEKM
jgi:hypothetical protein